MRNLDTVRRQSDRRAIAAGVVTQSVLIAVIYLFNTHLATVAITPVLSGIVTGFFSRSFEHEAIDGVFAAGIGAFTGIFLLGVLFWLSTPTLSQEFRLDFLFVFGTWTTFGAILFVPFISAIAGIVAQTTAHIRRTKTGFEP